MILFSEIRPKNPTEDIDRKNFYKALQELQGKLNTKIPEDLFKKIIDIRELWFNY